MSNDKGDINLQVFKDWKMPKRFLSFCYGKMGGVGVRGIQCIINKDSF